MSSAVRKMSSDGAEPGATGGLEPFGACPLPASQYDHIVLGHGSGGWLTAELIQHLFLPSFGNDVLARLEDQATVRLGGEAGVSATRLAFTTDAAASAAHGQVQFIAVGTPPGEDGSADLRYVVKAARDIGRKGGEPCVSECASRRVNEGGGSDFDDDAARGC